MLKPRHLEKIYHPTDDKDLQGNILCPCGCRAFKIHCFGEFSSPNTLSLGEYGDKYGQAVKAVCAACGAEHLLYDFALHGYDGLICGYGLAIPEEMLADFVTESDSSFEVKMLLEYDEEEQFLEEIVNNEDLQKDFAFTIDDRANIWSWLAIELKGVQSGTVYRDFVNEELA